MMSSSHLRRPTALLAPVLLLTLVATGCQDGAESERRHSPREATVETLRIEPSLLRDTVQFAGQLRSEKTVMLKSEVEGILASIEFEEGQRVKRGDVLFRLRNDEEAALLREAQANLALAELEHERSKQLLQSSAISESIRDRNTAELAVAKARVALARVALQRTEIRAPFDGVIGARAVSPGELLTDKTPLVQIDAVERLQAVFALPEIALPVARVGIPVDILVAPYPDERFRGKVFFVSPTLDPSARRILAKAWIPNQDGRLAAGLYANVEVEIRRQEDALLVPESAVVSDRLGTFVWRVDDQDLAERAPIKIGLRQAGRVEILGGLERGDRIVTAGTHKVSAGKKVSEAKKLAAGDGA